MKELLERKYGDPIRNRLAMLEVYDTQYGIYDHNKVNADPMAVFLMHPAEDPLTDSRLEILMRDILDKRLPELLNMDVFSILNLPRVWLDFFLKAVKPNQEETPEALAKKAARAVEEQLAQHKR